MGVSAFALLLPSLLFLLLSLLLLCFCALDAEGLHGLIRGRQDFEVVAQLVNECFGIVHILVADLECKDRYVVVVGRNLVDFRHHDLANAAPRRPEKIDVCTFVLPGQLDALTISIVNGQFRSHLCPGEIRERDQEQGQQGSL